MPALVTYTVTRTYEFEVTTAAGLTAAIEATAMNSPTPKNNATVSPPSVSSVTAEVKR